jgi:Zn-dependent protease
MNVARQTTSSVHHLVAIGRPFNRNETVPFRFSKAAAPAAVWAPRAGGCAAAVCHHHVHMFGGNSIRLTRIFGIRIGVDVSWFLVLFLIIWQLSGYYQDLFPGQDTKAFSLAVISALLFFLSILLHELGHAVVAIRNGIPIVGIDLWMFGGVAKLDRDTDSPGVEFRVAVAGPLVTLAIALVCFGIGAVISSPDDVVQGSRFEVGALGGATAVLSYLAAVNLIVLVFNLIPGFPMDGGRIARAIAWWRTGDRNRATVFAARLGRAIGYVMVGAGIWLLFFADNAAFTGIWLAFIGVFLSQAARSAEVQASFAGRMEGLRVADVMDAEPVALPDTATVERAHEDFFLRYGWPWFPVVDDSGHLVGLVTRESIESVDELARATTFVRAVMARDDDGSGLRVRLEEPLEMILGREGLSRLGAMMAVDADGVLRGIVTVDQIRRALRAPSPVTDPV